MVGMEIPSKVMEGLSSKDWMKFMIRIQIPFLSTGSCSKRIAYIDSKKSIPTVSPNMASKLPEDRPKLTPAIHILWTQTSMKMPWDFSTALAAEVPRLGSQGGIG